LNINVSGASPYVQNLSFAGPAVNTISTNRLYRHTLTSAGIKAWSVSWNEVSSAGSKSCSTTAGFTIPVPSCGTADIETLPTPLVWGNPINLKVAFNPSQTLASTPHTYTLTSSVHNTLTDCSGDLLSPTGETCTLPWIDMDPKTYPWTLTWKTETKACPAVSNTSCSNLPPLVATNQPGYLETTNGVAYIREINNQPYFSKTQSLSSNVFGSANPDSTAQVLKCTGNAFNCTKSNYLLLGYSDSNAISTSQSWYLHLKSILAQAFNVNRIILEGPKSMADISANLVNTKENIIEINGDFNATGVCTNSNIFLISGNLNITPDFKLSETNKSKNACIFIVKGTTVVLNNQKSVPTCSGNHINNATEIPSMRDTIEAFIITNDFTTNTSARQLYIKGGLITNTFTNSLK
jgi:hypothetical protein